MTDQPRTRRARARGATGIALSLTLLSTMGVAAQSPTATTAPSATEAPTRSIERTDRDRRRGPDRVRSWRGHGDVRGSRRSGARERLRESAARSSTITVTAIDGPSLALETADGWTRTIDTTGVALTRDGATIAITDILVGERVRVVQTRNADGTWTVTGIEVRPAIAVGTVGTVSADGFTIVGSDGTTTNVSVDATTTWSARGSSSATIADATAGRAVAVRGTLQADGSILAQQVRLG